MSLLVSIVVALAVVAWLAVPKCDDREFRSGGMCR